MGGVGRAGGGGARCPRNGTPSLLELSPGLGGLAVYIKTMAIGSSIE